MDDDDVGFTLALDYYLNLYIITFNLYIYWLYLAASFCIVNDNDDICCLYLLIYSP
jgi:hypothetical protein